MLKWFSLSGISKEIKRIRWPKVKDITENTGEVLLFVLAFGAFFIVSDLVITFILKLIGIGAYVWKKNSGMSSIHTQVMKTA